MMAAQLVCVGVTIAIPPGGFRVVAGLGVVAKTN
jgi:hypothetical protein